MHQAVKPYRFIDIVGVRHVVTVCNPKGNAPDIAISNSNNVFFSWKNNIKTKLNRMREREKNKK